MIGFPRVKIILNEMADKSGLQTKVNINNVGEVTNQLSSTDSNVIIKELPVESLSIIKKNEDNEPKDNDEKSRDINYLVKYDILSNEKASKESSNLDGIIIDNSENHLNNFDEGNESPDSD